MQVVYSGGSSTPTPSPRLPRKAYGYGQPFMPGYMPGQSVPTSAHSTVSHHHHHHQRKAKVSGISQGDASLRDSIPAMSKPVAIICLICNILLPGLGTFISGLTVLCCSHIRHKGATKQSVVRINSWVALLQFLTAFLFLLGWIWSVMWGAAFISISGEYHRKPASGSNHGDQSAGASGGVSEAPNSTSHERNLQSNVTNRNQTRVQSAVPCTSHVTSATSPVEPAHPMIVLQEPPLVVQPATSDERTKPILSHINPRQQRILRRRISDTEFSPFQLTNQRLEDIIIHDAAPVPNGNSPSSQTAVPPEKPSSSEQSQS